MKTIRRLLPGLVFGLLLGALTAASFGFTVLLWIAAVWSLVTGPTGHWVLSVIYVATAVAAPLPLLWCVHGLSTLQRDRLGRMSGVLIEPPPTKRSWRAVGTWRQLAYHLATATLVLPVLPRTDEAMARRLLGPSQAEALALRVESLARSRADVVAATDAERRRIERDLHDGTQQRLLSLAMNLGMARAALVDAPDPARTAIEQAHDEATLALTELREFVRGLHPAVLDDRGLDAALSGIVARSPLPVTLRVDVPARCAPSIEAIAYFVVSEGLANVVRHAEATKVEVVVERAGDRLRVAVTDDGRGGAVIASERLPAGSGGSGLRGLGQRAAAVDGTLTVTSPPGGPTSVVVELPCE
ncbi:sensor histidine kinase [Frankia nepalensis]|uniref:sensor histidine kinase n=1 Tax=Frankia nepalensis TaxID=1836974 RepID=UPI001932AC32|nr:histidine kinase [Frankia nepalensis]